MKHTEICSNCLSYDLCLDQKLCTETQQACEHFVNASEEKNEHKEKVAYDKEANDRHKYYQELIEEQDS